jgi:hypothetical protein
MSLLSVLQKGIKLADKIVKPLEATVTFQKYVSTGDGYGTGSYPHGPQSLRAIVEWKTVEVATSSGQVPAARPTVLFLDIDALMEATLGEGIKEEDSITLSDGTTGPISTIGGFMDASTNRLIYTEVSLG